MARTSSPRAVPNLDVLEQLGDAAMGSVFAVVGPVRGENLVGLAAEQEVEFLLEDAVELFAEHLSSLKDW
jgi:hypothetical protein